MAFHRINTKGFTLIELSIVLVIIGLIVGGVLVGRDLIHAAQVRQTMTQKEKFESAANTFRSKYNCLPGNCANATALGFSGGNGAGDGIIYTTYQDVTHVVGIKTFWSNLKEANLISDVMTQVGWYGYPGDWTPICPICKLNPDPDCGGGAACKAGGWTEVDFDQFDSLDGDTFASGGGQSIHARSLVLSSYNTTGGSSVGILTLADAYALDAKLDDGKPMSGSLITVADNYDGSWAKATDGWGVSLNQATGTSTSGYTVSNTTARVDVIMKAGF